MKTKKIKWQDTSRTRKAGILIEIYLRYNQELNDRFADLWFYANLRYVIWIEKNKLYDKDMEFLFFLLEISHLLSH